MSTTTLLDPDVLDELAASSAGARLESPHGPLPLTAVDATTDISGLIATTRYSQRFVNPTSEHLEVTYVFPLPSRASVGQFEAVLGGRRVTGVLKERSQARADYAEALAENRRAALTEQERPDVFTTSIGNIAPGEEAVVSLVVTGPVVVEDGEATFRFPLVTGIRYTEGQAIDGERAGVGTGSDTDAVPDASRLNPPRLDVDQPRPELHFRVRIDHPGVTIDKVTTSHLMSMASSGRPLTLTLTEGTRMDSDLLVRFALAGELSTQALFADDPSSRSEDGTTAGTWSVTLVPPRVPQATPRDVVVMLDRSGSMAGWKIVAARRAAARLVDTLDAADRFCVLGFDTSMDVFSTAGTPGDPGEDLPAATEDAEHQSLSLCPATDRNRFSAVGWLSRLSARGGTRMREPLVAAARLLSATSSEREPVIVLVTDGQISGEAHLLESLDRIIGRTRFCVVGIDRLPNTGLLERLGRRTSGYVTFVESETRLDVALTHLHRRIGRPDLLDVSVTAASGGLELLGADTTPAGVVDAFSGVPCIVTGRYRRHGPETPRLRMTARTAASDQEFSVTLVAQEVPAAGVSAMWARSRIADLEDAYDAGRALAARDEIVALSVAHGVLSRFTAFVAVDDEHQEIVGSRSVAQPVEPPSGWQMVGTVALRGLPGLGLSAASAYGSQDMALRAAGAVQDELTMGACTVSHGYHGPVDGLTGRASWGSSTWGQGIVGSSSAQPRETAVAILAECLAALSRAKSSAGASVTRYVRRLGALHDANPLVLAAHSALLRYIAGTVSLPETIAELERILERLTLGYHAGFGSVAGRSSVAVRSGSAVTGTTATGTTATGTTATGTTRATSTRVFWL